jgi:hypothetical protein
MTNFSQFPPQPQPQPQSYFIPPAPQRPRVWSLGFIFAVAFIAVLGSVLSFYSIASMTQHGDTISFYPGNLFFLLINTCQLCVALAGLWFTRSWAMRVGLALLAAAALSFIINSFIDDQIIIASTSSTFYFFLYVITDGINLAGLVCLSYGLARWQRSDAIALPAQLLLTLALGLFLITRFDPTTPGNVMVSLTITTFCKLAASFALLARPACWKASPLITLCLTIGTLIDLIYYAFAIGPFPSFTDPQPFLIYYTIGAADLLLFLLGLVLLAQTERVKALSFARPSLPQPQPVYAPPPPVFEWVPPPSQE